MEKICQICGKEYQHIGWSKYCSEECAKEAKRRGARKSKKETYIYKGKRRYVVTCIYCNENFEAGSATGKVCKKPECQRKYKDWIAEQSAKKRESHKKKPKVVAIPITDIVTEATKLGISYGEYVARFTQMTELEEQRQRPQVVRSEKESVRM